MTHSRDTSTGRCRISILPILKLLMAKQQAQIQTNIIGLMTPTLWNPTAHTMQISVAKWSQYVGRFTFGICNGQ